MIFHISLLVFDVAREMEEGDLIIYFSARLSDCECLIN